MSPHEQSPLPSSGASQSETPINLDDEEGVEPLSPHARAMGQKQAKELKRKGKKAQASVEEMAIAIRSIAETNQASVDLIKKRDEDNRNIAMRYLALEEAKEDERIMSKDTSNMTPPSKAWWKKRKSEVKAKTMPESGSSGCYIPKFDAQE